MAMKLKLHKSASGSDIQVSEAAFGSKFNEALIHQVVTAYMAGGRSGTKGQKNRSSARGGGAKPWRQKGTGRARAGTIRSPIWVGGGRTFAAQTRDHSQKVNRKMYRAGMASIFSQLVREGRLAVVDTFSIDAPKTKLLDQKVKGMGMDSVLIITDAPDENLALSSRNLPNVHVVQAGQADPVSLLHFGRTIVTKAAVSRIEEMLS